MLPAPCTQHAESLVSVKSYHMQRRGCCCRFHIMGGECNYLLRVSRDSEKRLEFVPDEQWKSQAMMAWSEEAIQSMLSSAESVLRETAHRLRLPVTVRSSPLRLSRTTHAPQRCQCKTGRSKTIPRSAYAP